MRKRSEYPFKVSIKDNGWQEVTPEYIVWRRGEIQEWVHEYYGYETIFDSWTSVTKNGITTYYFMREEDFEIFILRAGDRIVNAPGT